MRLRSRADRNALTFFFFFGGWSRWKAGSGDCKRALIGFDIVPRLTQGMCSSQRAYELWFYCVSSGAERLRRCLSAHGEESSSCQCECANPVTRVSERCETPEENICRGLLWVRYRKTAWISVVSHIERSQKISERAASVRALATAGSQNSCFDCSAGCPVALVSVARAAQQVSRSRRQALIRLYSGPSSAKSREAPCLLCCLWSWA